MEIQETKQGHRKWCKEHTTKVAFDILNRGYDRDFTTKLIGMVVKAEGCKLYTLDMPSAKEVRDYLDEIIDIETGTKRKEQRAVSGTHLPQQLPHNHPGYNDLVKRRLLSKTKWEGSCLMWQGKLDGKKKYGRIIIRDSWKQVHVEFFERIYPKKRMKHEFSHQCKNTQCVIHGVDDTRSGNILWDRGGQHHHNAVIPDRWLPIIVDFYRKKKASQTEMAKWLTKWGFQVASITISNWVTGRSRSQNL